MTNQPVESPNKRGAWLRDFMPALLATVIVIGTVGLMLFSLAYLENKDAFDRVKELLLFINPLLGVAVGYYFNKSSTEGRAESAEATARTATVVAQQAQLAQTSAEAQAQLAQTTAQAATLSLNELTPLAEQLLQTTSRPATAAEPGTLSGQAFATPLVDDQLMRDLQTALARARSVPGVR